MPPTTTPAPPTTGRRRGRPRSPVFRYFNRIVDDTGDFVGNQCQFCAFVSRDRSENPTYLTRHLLRSCTAPQDVRDAMAARHPTNVAAKHSALPKPSQAPAATAAAPADVAAAAAVGAHAQNNMQVSPHRLPYNRNLYSAAANPSMSAAARLPLKAAGTPMKNRRGRPRSPALAFFVRHTNEAGIFIANQCTFCSFVSRDRSENSTLLLRHLLSPSCATPQDVVQVLRSRTSSENLPPPSSASAADMSATAAAVAASRRPRVGPAVSPRGEERNNTVATMLGRFFLIHNIPYHAISSPLFQQIIRSLTRLAAETEDPTAPFGAAASPQSLLPESAERQAPKTVHPLPSPLQVEKSVRTAVVKNVLENVHHALGIPEEDGRSPEMDMTRGATLVVLCPRSSTHHSATKDVLTLRPTAEHAVNGGASTAEQGPFGVFTPVVASAFGMSEKGSLVFLGAKWCNGRASFDSFVTGTLSQRERVFCRALIAGPRITATSPRLPSQHADLLWMVDVAHQVDALCHQLIGSSTLLHQAMQGVSSVASFFTEFPAAAVTVFGERDVVRDNHGSPFPALSALSCNHRCTSIVKATRELLVAMSRLQQLAQAGPFGPRVEDILLALEPTSAGSDDSMAHVVRLVMSSGFRQELEAFTKILAPLAQLSTLYDPCEVTGVPGEIVATRSRGDLKTATMPEYVAGLAVSKPRSIARVWTDCHQIVRDLDLPHIPEYHVELEQIRKQMGACLVGNGVFSSMDAIASDLCYLAVLMDPAMKSGLVLGLAQEVEERLKVLVETGCCEGDKEAASTVWEQLLRFSNRKGEFADETMFSTTRSTPDPENWWLKYGNVSPELQNVALLVMNTPTCSSPIARYITDANMIDQSLHTVTPAEDMQKQLYCHWNLRLQSQSIAAAAGRDDIGGVVV